MIRPLPGSAPWQLLTSLRCFQLDHITGNLGGVAVQYPGPEPLFLHLGVDQRVAAFGLDGSILGAYETVVLADWDDAQQHDAGGAGFAVADNGVLACVVLRGFHGGAGATCQGETKNGCCNYFTGVLHLKLHRLKLEIQFSRGRHFKRSTGRLKSASQDSIKRSARIFKGSGEQVFVEGAG